MKLYSIFFLFIAVAPLLGMEKAKVPAHDEKLLPDAVLSGFRTQFLGHATLELYLELPKKLTDELFQYRYPAENNQTLFSIICKAKPEDMSEKEYEACIRLILEQEGLNVHAQDTGGATALHYAAANPDSTALRLLMENAHKQNIDLNARVSEHNSTALHIATENNYVENVRLLLSNASVNPNMPDALGYSPLCYTLRERKNSPLICQLASMRNLAERGASFEFEHDGKKRSVIDIALFEHRQLNPQALTCLIGLLALDAPLKGKDLTDLKVIIAEGDVHHINASMSGWSALGFPPVQRADASQQNIFQTNSMETGWFLNACFMAAIEGTTLSIAKEQAEPSINVQDEVFGMTPLMWAAARGNVGLFWQLLQLRADTLKIDSFGDTALHHAVRNGHIEIARYLQDLGPLALIVKNNNGRTPVDVAISSKKPKEMLLALAQ